MMRFNEDVKMWRFYLNIEKANNNFTINEKVNIFYKILVFCTFKCKLLAILHA